MKRGFFLPNREYKSGSAFTLWRWSYVPSGYIIRLHIVKTPLGAICLHFMNSPDPEPYEHDHPVSFLSFILRGRYKELRSGIYFERRWINLIRAKTTHSIVALEGSPITFCLMGPKTQEWGYITETGKMHWKTYKRIYHASR